MSTKEIFLDVAAKLPPDATIVDAKALLSQDGLKNLGKGVARLKMKRLTLYNLSHLIFVALILTGCASERGGSPTPPPTEAIGEQNAAAVAAHGNRGVDLFEKDKVNEAIIEFDRVLNLDPNDALAHYYRGVSFLLNGRNNKAIADLEEAVRLDPKDAEAWQSLGIAHGRSKQFQDSVSDFNQAIGLNPKFAPAFSCLAALRATCCVDDIRDGPEAVRLATTACELTNWEVSLHLERLAAAYAESKDWDEAIKYENKAIRAGGDKEDLNRRQICLSLYQSHLMFRDPTIFQ